MVLEAVVVVVLLEDGVQFPDLDDVVRADGDEETSAFVKVHVADAVLHVVEPGQRLFPEIKSSPG